MVQLPEALKRLIGTLEYTNLPEALDVPNALTIATDGTEINGYGGEAFIIVDKAGNKLKIHLNIDGNTEKMDSLRAELCGILAVLMIMSGLLTISEPDSNKNFTSTHCNDSESSLKLRCRRGCAIDSTRSGSFWSGYIWNSIDILKFWFTSTAYVLRRTWVSYFRSEALWNTIVLCRRTLICLPLALISLRISKLACVSRLRCCIVCRFFSASTSALIERIQSF